MIVLLGGTGYVGHAFNKLLRTKDVAYLAPQRREMDYSHGPTLLSFLRQYRPEFVINAAGYTGKPNVDASESQKLRCLQANTILPGVISEACQELAVPWGHVSSGCIFNGVRSDGGGFMETDVPNFSFRQNNCSFYSGTKALGEEILAKDASCYTWRLRIPFNEVNEPRNYLYKLMMYEKLVDLRNSISQLDEFVRACYECWERRVPFGAYNVTNPGSVTTREVVDLIDRKGLCKKNFKFFESEEEFRRLATLTPRASCVMDSSKLQSVGIQMTEIHEALEWCLTNWRDPHLRD
jgi:dTDP-4-dehydrorhamnose reductase